MLNMIARVTGAFLLAAAILGSGAAAAASRDEVHWSLRPISRPEVPSAAHASDREWIRTPVDAFVLARLREKGLTPSAPAGRRALIRRITFDLTGLPPTPEEIAGFLADESQDAYERLVDRLLASPHYGERWARHWMDVVHYADTHGHDEDKPRPNAWPYRDYLIRSFNEDKPYARFVEEQLAGDVLYPDDPQAVVATGLLAAGPWDQSSMMGIQDGTLDKQAAIYLDRDDMVATTMSTFASVTVHCARCHDHKFDPISQEDYYAFQADFAGVDRIDRPFDPDPQVQSARQRLLRQKKILDQATCPAEAERAAGIVKSAVERELAALPPQQFVYAVASDFEARGNFKSAGGKPRPVQVLRRGDIRQPIGPAKPGALSCVYQIHSRFALSDPENEGGRRAALAGWIAHQDNPLTWRSIVNRVWHYHFGRGIVETPNDFGRMGGTPSHPELLDWLAAAFRDDLGGSLKRLHRLIVTSSTYRQSSEFNEAFAHIDADNRLLWRMDGTRLDGESIHDAVLMVSGQMDFTMGGPPVRQFVESKGVHETPNADYGAFDMESPAVRRRSVYRFIFRTVPDPLMQSLDCPDASQLTPQRQESITALQALAMLNDRFIVRQSEHAAARLAKYSDDPTQQVVLLYELALGRPPEADEAEAVARYAAEHGMANACRFVLNSNEFLFVP